MSLSPPQSTRRAVTLASVILSVSVCVSLNAGEPDSPFDQILQRLDLLEQDNQRLQAELQELRAQPAAPRTPVPQSPENVVPPQPAFLVPEQTEPVLLFDHGGAPPLVTEDQLRSLIAEEIGKQTPPGPIDPPKKDKEADDRLAKLEKSWKEFQDKSKKVTYPTVKVTGFFQADSVWVHQDADNRIAIVDGAPLGDIQDGVDFRRARLAAAGDLAKNLGYMIEMDFAFPGRPSFMDVYGDIRDLPVVGNLRFGQWRQPFSIDGLTSVKELVFLERALPFAFLPFRQTGVGFYDSNECLGLTWAGSVFRYPVDFFGGNVGDDGGYGFAGRVTWLALDWSKCQTVHVGAGYSFADPSNDQIRFRNQPELFVGETPGAPFPAPMPGSIPAFVDTGALAANNYNLYGTELASTWGPLFFQSEWMVATVDRIAAADTTFWGAYAQVAYCLTGEYHPYNKKSGVYTRIVPDHPLQRCCGFGAWEIAARWSMIDLVDQDVRGNELQDLTLGLNWYLHKNMKFQFNYIHPILTADNGTSSADLFALRGQVDF
ncbi:MAG: hypothetical protein KDA80_13445 [Planctomycetaceae bacterium]|nr:hypothetical protein [Planctomycetaceae bacterium]